MIARGRHEEAEALVAEVMETEPRHLEALGAQGRLLRARGETREALSFLEKAARPRDPDSQIELAEAYLEVGDTAKAREAAGRVLRQTRGHPWALAVQGHALVLEGEVEQGVAILNQALALRPRRAEVWRCLADAFAAAGDASKAALCRRSAAAVSG
jgi:predicted Zn-dependent protease